MRQSITAAAALIAGVGVLIAGVGFGYRQLVSIPAEAAAVRVRYGACLKAADDASRRRWARQCANLATERPAKLQECLAKARLGPPGIRDLERSSCQQDLAVPAAGECRIAAEEARRFDGLHAAARAECLAAAEAQL